MTELHQLSALEQSAAVRRREISARQLTQHYLARINRHNPALPNKSLQAAAFND